MKQNRNRILLATMISFAVGFAFTLSCNQPPIPPEFAPFVEEGSVFDLPWCGNPFTKQCQVTEDCQGGLFCRDGCCVSVPAPGKDIVVFNDINPFDNVGMVDLNNVLMVSNLVDFTTTGPRGSGTVVWFDRGRDSRCGGTGECGDGALSTMRSTIEGAGYSITNISSTSGSITNIPEDVKVVFLWNPLVQYTTEEINVFKLFANDGGRLVFVGEWDGYYGPGIPLENEFLLKMGAVMTNIGLAVDCGYTTLPTTSLRANQITDGMSGVTIACSSVIIPGPPDFPLYYDTTNTQLLAAVATIDVTPLPSDFDSLRRPWVPGDYEGLDPRSSTGH